MDNEIVQALKQQIKLLEDQNKQMTWLRSQISEQNRMIEVLGRIGLRDVLADVDSVIQSRQMTMMETMAAIQSGKSIARWGDGELKLMLQPEFELMFQQSSSSLAEELSWMIRENDRHSDRLIIGLPSLFVTRMWMGIWAENWHLLRPLLAGSKSSWGNTHVTRPVFFERHGQEAVEAWRSVWQNKRVCVVAGRGSRFELLPALFDNVASVVRVDSEPTNAYSKIDELKTQLRPMVDDIDVFLIALGPTGTILAGHLSSDAGGANHAIDIGHLSSSYQNVFHKAPQPEQQPIKQNA